MAEITNLICAHCGGNNPVRNYMSSDGTLSLTKLTYEIVLVFTCMVCKKQYFLPVEQPQPEE